MYVWCSFYKFSPAYIFIIFFVCTSHSDKWVVLYHVFKLHYAYDVEKICMCLFTIYPCSKIFLHVFFPYSNWFYFNFWVLRSVFFVVVACLFSLFYTSPLSVMWFENIFFHSVVCLFILFTEQNLKFLWYPIYHFCLLRIVHLISIIKKKTSLLSLDPEDFSPMFFL